MGAGAGQTGGGMQQMPQQTAMQQAMPVGAPAQSNKGGLGALAAQRQQGGQADPRLMEMFKRLQGGIPGAGQMPQGPQMGFGQGMQMGQPGGFGQMDPRAMAAMQAFQNQGGMPADPRMGTFGPNDMPNRPMPYDPRKPGGMMDVPVQLDPRRPMPIGAGGKGAGMPPPGMIDQLRPGVPVQRPMPMPPGVNRPMPVPMPLPPGLNRPMPMPGYGGGLPPDVSRTMPMPGYGGGLPPGLNRPMPMPLPPGLNRTMPAPMPPGLNRPMPMPIPKPAPQPARPTPKPVNPRFNQIMPFLR